MLHVKKIPMLPRLKAVKSACLLVLFVLLGCDSDDSQSTVKGNCIRGTGPTVTESRTLSNFHSINSTIVADIFLTQGPQEDIVIQAQQNILPLLETTVINQELILDFDGCVEELDKISVTVVVPELRQLALTGVGNYVMQDDFELDALDISLVGVGEYRLRGTANMLSIDLVNVGNVNAFELSATSCDVSIIGVGDVEVLVTDQLDVSIVGVGNVFYRGMPTITSNITGQGAVIDAN